MHFINFNPTNNAELTVIGKCFEKFNLNMKMLNQPKVCMSNSRYISEETKLDLFFYTYNISRKKIC